MGHRRLGGSGTLNFRAGATAFPRCLDYGLVFGGSKTVLRGRVSNINRASDVAGVMVRRAQAWRSPRRAGDRADQPKGAVLELAGQQTGLMANADLSGLAITLK